MAYIRGDNSPSSDGIRRDSHPVQKGRSTIPVCYILP
jgi:hypothetical protein